MAETLTLEVALGQHWFGVDPRTHESTCTCGWQGPMRLGNPLGRQSDQKAHLADAVRAWLLGQRSHVAEALLTEHMDGDYLVGAGRTIGNEGGDVGLSDARAAEVVCWAADGVLGSLAGSVA